MAITYTRISTTASGAQANSDSYSASVSADGNLVAFYSFANNLVAGDTNGAYDVFLKNLATGAVTRLSTTAAGVQANGESLGPTLSSDGGRVAFTSQATNLAASDTNGVSDVFVKTLATGAVVRASTDAAGSQANGESFGAVISPDGTKVAFISYATNLVAGDTNGYADLIVKDLGTGAVTRIALSYPASSAGTGALGFAPDGTHIVIANGGGVYLADLSTGASMLVSTRGDGSRADGGNNGQPAVSADGTKIAFQSDATFLVAGAQVAPGIFVKDLTTGAVTRVSTSATGVQADSASQNAHFSPDGTQIVFVTFSDNLVAGTVLGATSIVVKDLTTGVVTLVAEINGQGKFDGGPQFTPDGKSIVFSTPASLVSADGNGASDIYLAALPAPPAGSITFASGGAATTPENIATSTVVYTALATDSVAGQALTYILSGGPDAGLFNIEASTGAVTLKASPDFEVPIDGGHSNLYRIIVTATDGVRATGRSVTISVTDLNDNPPMFNSATVATVASGLAAGATAYTAHAVDADVANTLTYSLAGGADATKFAVNAATGAVSFKAAPSYAAPDDAGADHVYDLVVRASDGLAAHEATRAVRITVADPAVPPVVVAPTPVASVSLVSTNAAGVEGNAFSGVLGSSDAAFSADGTQIAFVSWSDNLLAGDTNGGSDIFVKTLSTGAVSRISTDSSGGQISSYLQTPIFSPDGERVLFSSFGAVFSGNSGDVALKDLVTGALTLVSADAAAVLGAPGAGSASFSADGARVIFSAGSSGVGASLVSGDTNLAGDIYVKTLATGNVIRVSDSTAGEIGNGLSLTPVLSPDGTKAAFATDATNLFPGDTNGRRDIVIKDLATGVVTQVSVNTAGVGGDGDSTTPVFSPDGTKVAFVSKASNLVAGDTNDALDVFVKDLATGVVTRVSVGDAGEQGNGDSYKPIFSADGAKLLFTSTASNLSSRDGNGVSDAFVKDLATGGLTLVSVDATGASANAASIGDAISADGRRVLFESGASNATAGDVNGVSDVFLATMAATTVNTPPMIGGTIANQADAAGVAIHPFSTVTITDPDAGQSETLTVSFAAGAGTLSGSFLSQTSPGVYTVPSSGGGPGVSAATFQANLRATVFTPTAGQSGTTAFTISVNDGQATATDSTTSVVTTYTTPVTPPAGGGGTATTITTPPSVQYGLLTEFQNLERALAGGVDALTSGTPVHANFQAETAVAAQFDAGQITLAQAEGALAHLVDATTGVAVASYAFFTGFTPTAAGLNYLVHSTANGADLNDAYYARFSTGNRYINFAVNLATGPGAGSAVFQASYGALSLADATAKAYLAVFGTAADAAKITALLDTPVSDGLGGLETRAQYFAQYGGDGANGQGTKAAMIGFLLSTAVRDGSGVYGAATEHYLAALAHGSAPDFGSELALHYGPAVNLVGVTPAPDPAVIG